MKPLGPSELRVLRRLALDPTERQVGIAEQLGVSRSAVSQIWNRLTEERSLRVRCLLDYRSLGFSILIGWAWSEEDAAAVEKFSRWLDANPFVIAKADALMSSKTDERVYFEVLLPFGPHHSSFLEKLVRFEKRPYNLTVEYEPVSTITAQTNLGLFNGNSWDFKANFRFEASIDAAREFSEILPAETRLNQGSHPEPSTDILVIGACLENDYYSSAAQVHDCMLTLGLSPPSLRTIRRRLSHYRDQLGTPYIEIQNVGLGPSIIACVDDLTGGSGISRLLHSQGHLLPRARILSGSRLVAMDISLPSGSDWFGFSISLSNMLKSDAQVCTFITKARIIRKGLEDVLPYLF
ncbi:Lrp/AsnC family transcriptional regulator [Candidatus Thorarchaeota archaeon]|nr:MAG: Lrp/AsnC family transcriptional regulator [Candidatus Thorarchaeota archaeon]